MPSKESLERAANYNRHDWHGTTPDGIHRYCELCVKQADLLDEAIREARATEILSLQALIHVSQKHVPLADMAKCQFQVCVDLQARLAQLREGKT